MGGGGGESLECIKLISYVRKTAVKCLKPSKQDLQFFGLTMSLIGIKLSQS